MTPYLSLPFQHLFHVKIYMQIYLLVFFSFFLTLLRENKVTTSESGFYFPRCKRLDFSQRASPPCTRASPTPALAVGASGGLRPVTEHHLLAPVLVPHVSSASGRGVEAPSRTRRDVKDHGHPCRDRSCRRTARPIRRHSARHKLE